MRVSLELASGMGRMQCSDLWVSCLSSGHSCKIHHWRLAQEQSISLREHWRRTAFESLHRLSHPGIRATQRQITTRYVWPGVSPDVLRWTCSCIQCQRAKIQRHSLTPLSPFTHQMLDLTLSTSAEWDHYHHHEDSSTS